MIDLLVDELKNVLSFADKVAAIGRQSLPNDDNERYYPADGQGIFVYVKYAGMDDYELQPVNMTSAAGNYIASSELDLYIFAACENMNSIALDVLRLLHKLPGFEVKAASVSTDKESILLEETGKKTKSNNLKAAKISFKASGFILQPCRTTAITCEKCP